MKIVVAATLLAASLAVPATAHADDVPTVDQVIGILQELTDPDKPAADKSDIVTPGFSPDEAGTIDNHLTRMKVFGGIFAASLPRQRHPARTQQLRRGHRRSQWVVPPKHQPAPNRAGQPGRAQADHPRHCCARTGRDMAGRPTHIAGFLSIHG